MKHIITTIAIFIFAVLFFNCKAQSPIKSIDSLDWEYQNNAYYKDLNNDLDAFEGTWLYTNGNTSLKMVLEKRTMQFNGDYYTDLIVGEYQYIKNGVEKINTLNQLSQDLGENHSIEGNFTRKTCEVSPVDDCVDGEIRLQLYMDDPLVNSGLDIILHNRVINGEDALKVNMSSGYGLTKEEDIVEPTLGFQLENMVFIKQ
ncbi:DUF6705 family protein [uncultured Winogradskyella sp.]|uniref:DUF6705 family protein n=1 Tax=uncultured Winogradskyella sp. TaxID=395353 RepID=UPI0026296013|nr:DUF6705 family protein [uncultured Winogradskyella sp.]